MHDLYSYRIGILTLNFELPSAIYYENLKKTKRWHGHSYHDSFVLYLFDFVFRMKKNENHSISDNTIPQNLLVRPFLRKWLWLDDFNFHITNFPFLSSNIPSSPAYGVFISQLIRYARACSSYECFILRAMRLSNKLLGQGYVKERLKSSLRKFYGRYGDLTKQYEVPLSRMLHDILDDDHIQWHPPLIGHYTNFWPLLIWTLLPNLAFYLIVQGFHRTYATGAACQQRTLTPPDTWSCPTLGLACVLMSRPISWTCLVSGLLNFEHPSVLLFCLMTLCKKIL